MKASLNRIKSQTSASSASAPKSCVREKRIRPSVCRKRKSVELRKAYARVVRLQNLLVRESRARHAVGPDLAEPDAVAPAAPRELESRDAARRLVEDSVNDEELFAEAERGAYAPAAQVRGAFRADEFEV